MIIDRLRRLILEKLVGAGFSFSLIIILYTVIYSLTLYDLADTLTSGWLWLAFYGYGIVWSFLVDLLIKKYPAIRRYELFIYVFGGLVVFAVINFEFGFILIAGSIGSLAALFFYFGKVYVIRQRSLILIFAIILPLLLLSLTLFDFTKKRNWEEAFTDTSFHVKFSYFNGEHRLPIDLQKDEKLTFSVNCETEAGWGYHMKDKNNEYVPLTEIADQLLLVAEEAATYYIVIKGSRARGTCTVNWSVNW